MKVRRWRSIQSRKVLVKEGLHAVCVVLDTLEDKRAVPRWSQCCSNSSNSHEKSLKDEPVTLKLFVKSQVLNQTRPKRK